MSNVSFLHQFNKNIIYHTCNHWITFRLIQKGLGCENTIFTKFRDIICIICYSCMSNIWRS